MALIACRECGTQVSTEAKTCPQCGVRVKKRSKLWLWLLGTPIALFLLLMIVVSNSPQAEAKAKARRTYELCLSEMNDPLRSPSHRMTARSMCERMRDDFRAKYNVDP